LKKELGCSEAELGIMVHTLPNVLTFKEVRVSRLVNYLKTVVGLETEYIVHRPALLCYSMKARLMPRRYVLKVLQAKGLVKKDIDFYNVVCLTEKRFVKRYLDRFKEDVPGLAGAYAEQVCSS
jgi:mTERF domain-containing protein, mitochondrial